MQRFDDKVVMVTGAASGIGRATVERIAAEGGSVTAVDLNETALAELTTALDIGDDRLLLRGCNVAVEAEVDAAVAAATARFGRLDALVNMAGILRFDNTADMALSDWQRLLDINLTGTFLMCRAALPLLEQSGGSIVNASSTAALAGLPYGAAYAATKAAIQAFTRSVAVEYAKRGVRANCVCPGDIQTGIMGPEVRFPPDCDASLIQRVMSPMGPTGPDAVASVIAMLASKDGRHITGEEVRVDGGMLA